MEYSAGDGLDVPLAEVRVTAPAQRPELLAYPRRDRGMPVHLVDLRPADGYRAALAVLTASPVSVMESLAAELLA